MAFLPGGVTPQWQKVKVPLHGLRSSINLARLGSLVLWFRYEGKGAVQIDDVCFSYDEEVERIQIENTPRASADPAAPRAMWIWKTDPINKPDIRKGLFDFSKKAAIRKYFIYLGEDPLPQTPQDYQKGLADFLRECHAQGIEVHALQGNPLWALKPYHPRVFSWIGGFLEFNRDRPAEERMDGVHMDIELYLTQEWETGDREKLKSEFLSLLDQCRQLIDQENTKQSALSRPWAVGKTAKKPFVMGLAIPLFYNREPEMEEKLLKHLDYAALMDYYDSARDIVDQGRPHVELAEHLGVEMVIGVETQDLVEMNQGKRRNTFIEEGWEEMETELAKVSEAFKKCPGFGGIAIHYYDSYRLLQRGRNVPMRERSGKVPKIEAPSRKQPITVDGDLSEWTDAFWVTMDKKEQVVYGAGAWNWSPDVSFKAAVSWEPKGLLLALDVTDDIHVQEKQHADMWEGDHLELWIDVDLLGDYVEAVNSSDDFQIGVSPGNFKEIPPEIFVWVPSIEPDSIRQMEIGAKPKPDGKGYTIEVRLPTAVLFQNVTKRIGVEPGAVQLPPGFAPATAALQKDVLESGELRPGFRFGLMIDGSDCDAVQQPQKCMLSTSTERQWGDPTTFNTVELK